MDAAAPPPATLGGAGTPPAASTPAPPPAAMREFLDLLRIACKLLMECGCSSNRVELLTQILGAAWGYEVETIAIPTGVWITVRCGGANVVDLTRVRGSSVDLDRLVRLNALIDSFYTRRISIAEATQQLAVVATRRPPYGLAVTAAAGGLSSPLLVHTYGGSLTEILLAFPLGICVQILNKYVLVGEASRFLNDFLCAAFIALASWGAARLLPGIDMARMIVGGIVILAPGLVTVNAVHELAQKNLVSGAAKLLEALMIASSLVSGVVCALGLTLLFR